MLDPATIYRLHHAAVARFTRDAQAEMIDIISSACWWERISQELQSLTGTTDEEIDCWRDYMAHIGDLHTPAMHRMGEAVLSLVVVDGLNLYEATGWALAECSNL